MSLWLVRIECYTFRSSPPLTAVAAKTSARRVTEKRILLLKRLAVAECWLLRQTRTPPALYMTGREHLEVSHGARVRSSSGARSVPVHDDARTSVRQHVAVTPSGMRTGRATPWAWYFRHGTVASEGPRLFIVSHAMMYKDSLTCEECRCVASTL